MVIDVHTGTETDRPLNQSVVICHVTFLSYDTSSLLNSSFRVSQDILMGGDLLAQIVSK